jgi:hypothetical protein
MIWLHRYAKLVAGSTVLLIAAGGMVTSTGSGLRPCSYCNRCLVNVLEHPLGCYDESRYPSYYPMMEELMRFYEDDWVTTSHRDARPSRIGDPGFSTGVPRPRQRSGR